MADDATDVQTTGADITPEDFDGEQVSPKTESSSEKSSEAEQAKSETPDESAKAEDDTAQAEAAKGTDDSVEAETDATEADKSKPAAETRKTQLNSEIRDLVARRNALKKEVTEANAEVYQPKTEKELVDDGMEPGDAKIEALRQEIAMRDYTEQVAEAQLTLESESDRVLRDFSWANPDSENFNKDLAEEAAALLESNLLVDRNTGQIVGSNISPYQLYKTLDKAAQANAAQNRLEGQKATEQMLASADAAASTSPPKKAEDSLAKLWADPL